MIPCKPKVKIKDLSIEIFFNNLHFLINTLSDEIWFKKTSEKDFLQIPYLNQNQSDFSKNEMKKENLSRPKARVKYFYSKDYIFGIDVSLTDNRLFFLAWLTEDYDLFRGNAFWKASYFSNPPKKQKEWFENDLSNPKTNWPFGQFQTNETKQKTITEMI